MSELRWINVAGAALNQTPLDWEGNSQNILKAIQQAQENHIQLLCLPELCITGYGCEDMFFAQYVTDFAMEILLELLPKTKNIVVAVGLPVTFENSIYNAVALLSDGKLLGIVAKQDLAGYGIHYEPRWFKRWYPGKACMLRWKNLQIPFGDLIFSIDGIRIGIEICEDAWSGQRPAQKHYQNNVDIILNPSASHFAFGKSETRKILVQESSRAYNCVYVYTNLVGNEAGRIIYDGEILIAQQGKLLAQNQRFSFQEVQLCAATASIDALKRKKRKAFNFLPECPSNLIEESNFCFSSPKRFYPPQSDFKTLSKEEEFYFAECIGLFDYMRKSRSRGFVISMSGGADSSACTILAVHSFIQAWKQLGKEVLLQKIGYWGLDAAITLEALIKEGVWGVYQSTANSSKATLESASALAKQLGITFLHWDVEPIVQHYVRLVSSQWRRALSWEEDDIALQNIQARVRAPSVWLLANLQGALLLSTSNRSEAAVGYATMDGDTAGGLAPIAGIDKAFLLQWLQWAKETLNLSALEKVLRLKPTAELRPPEAQQSDEADLMPYPLLDKIERAAIHQHLAPHEVLQWLQQQNLERSSKLPHYIAKFFQLWARNQWKRERYAPSFHLDDANLDPRTWCRFPILNGNFKKEIEKLYEHTKKGFAS